MANRGTTAVSMRIALTALADMRLGLHDHLMPPRYLLEKGSAEARSIADEPVDQSSLTRPLKRLPKIVDSRDKQNLTVAINEDVASQALPAYAKFARFVKVDYAPKGRTEYEICSLPNGTIGETLDHERGFLSGSFQRVRTTRNLMWRPIRLVVDTGVHSQRWSRQQIIDFSHQHTAMAQRNIGTEVGCYIAGPLRHGLQAERNDYFAATEKSAALIGDSAASTYLLVSA